MKRLVLASSSPRRKQLLAELGYDFQIIVANVNENSNAATPLGACVEQACDKALAVFKGNPDAVVIGCDTVVDVDGKVFGKPSSACEATQMLTTLSGRTHLVHSGACVVSSSAIFVFSDTTRVTFRQLTGEEIASYVQSGSPMDKAGAYGAQDSNFVSIVVGSFNNVVGLPTEKLNQILQKIYRG